VSRRSIDVRLGALASAAPLAPLTQARLIGNRALSDVESVPFCLVPSVRRRRPSRAVQVAVMRREFIT